MDAKKLTDITLPETLTYIGSNVFYGCKALSSITLPPEIETVESECFSHCDSLSEIVIPDKVTTIGTKAFYQCPALQSVTLPEGLLTIGNTAFSYDTALEEITLPESLETISSGAFSNCSSLKTIHIPANVTKISDSDTSSVSYSWCFYGCESLTAFTVDENNPKYSALDGVLYDKAQTRLMYVPSARSESLVIPDTVTDINSWAAYNCLDMHCVTIPASVVNIGDGAISYYNSGFTYSRVPHFRLYVAKDTAGEKYAQGLKFYDNGLQKNGYYLYTLDAVPSGDVNKDGEFSVVDVIQFQKWLLKVPDVTLADWKAVDFYADGVLNIYDLALMKRALINQSETIG